MLTTLTTYLLQHKQVTIPFIGSFELRQEPARLDFPSRLILPPANEVAYSENDKVDEKQLILLSEATATDVNQVQQQLQTLGKGLKESLAHAPFEWKGIGRLEQNGSGVSFYSTFHNKLKPVAADKVIREKASHAVTIGDKEMQSHEASEMLDAEPKKSYLTLIIILLLIAALLFIAYLFYTKGFSPLSTGLQQRLGWLIITSPTVYG